MFSVVLNPKTVLLAACVLTPTISSAYSDNYNASTVWGTMPGGVAVSGAFESASTHAANGSIAGQVNAAKQGLLINTGGAGTIYAIGSQSIVSSTIYGDDNHVSQDADQDTENTGNVENDGQFYN